MSNNLEYSLGLDVAPLQRSGRTAVTAAGQIADEIEKKFRFQNLGRTLAAALGINVQSIADNIARAITGISKAEEDALQKLESLTERIAEKQIANMRAALADEQQYQLLLQERDRLQTRIEENRARTAVDQLALAQDKLSLLEKEEQMNQLIEKIERDRQEAAKKAWDERQKIEKMFADAFDKQDQMIAERQKEFTEFMEAVRKYADENRELLLLEHNARRGLNDEEAKRLQLLRLQKKERETDDQIMDLIAKKLSKDITPEELKRLDALILQQKVLKGQITSLTEVKSAVAAVGQEIISNTEKWRNFTIAVQRTGRDDRDLSDRELARKLANLQRDLFDREVRTRETGNYDPAVYFQRLELSKTEAELDLRRRVRQTAAMFGEDRAFQMFDGLSEQRFADILRQSQDTSEQTNLLREIRDGQRRGFQALSAELKFQPTS